ncbi:MAG: LysM peptidoglycan-binding domain-containing protein, partial [Leptolyngbya sp. SIO1D8]|nr:LysM peptidoglycan-binding domain-containing protein [Leptolyngbya sp. SIO1D8]
MVLAGAAPAGALELGDIEVQSYLGQPLRASVAYALGPNEALADYCISLAPGTTLNGLPAVNRARITVTDGVIAITGNTPIREPLMSARLSIQCPYTPNIARDYMLFIDPAGAAEPVQARAAVTPAAPTAPARAPEAPRPAIRQTPPATAERNRPAVASGTLYRVQPGDSLSAIAQRLEGREVGLWQAVNAIFAANPEAFIGNDPNRLKAGSLLQIPTTAMLGDGSATFPSAAATPAQRTAAGADDTAYLEPAQ